MRMFKSVAKIVVQMTASLYASRIAGEVFERVLGSMKKKGDVK